MRIGVPEAVRVNSGRVEAGHIGPYLEPLTYPVGRESASLTLVFPVQIGISARLNAFGFARHLRVIGRVG
jgi:hypothetical protein